MEGNNTRVKRPLFGTRNGKLLSQATHKTPKIRRSLQQATRSEQERRNTPHPLCRYARLLIGESIIAAASLLTTRHMCIALEIGTEMIAEAGHWLPAVQMLREC